MDFLVNFMIYAGSALMLYNIIKYGTFVRNSLSMDRQNHKKELLIIPLLLLVFFLIAYIAVAISGIGNLLIAAILFGGSVFVFLLLTVIYRIIATIRETEQVLYNRYEDMKAELDALTQDTLAAFRVNLTRDEVEEKTGEYLYDTDLQYDSYSEIISHRKQNMLGASEEERGSFDRQALIDRYMDGQTEVSQVFLVRRKDGEMAYVNFEAMLSKMPVSGDIVAFITERPYNEEMIKRTLLEKVLMDRYDRISYMVNGHYRVLISNDGKKKHLLLPADSDVDYETLYLNYILPAFTKERRKTIAYDNPLRLSVIDKALEENEVYEVNEKFVLDGETRYKQILFYRIDKNAKFYLMLISDSTKLQEEQTEQNRQLSDALAEAVRLNQERIEFFTSISRDIKAPVDGILRAAAKAREESDYDAAMRHVERVEATGRQLHSLTEDLEAISLIDSGAVVLAEEPTELALTVRALEKRFEKERPEKAITFRTDISGLGGGRVLCDEERLRTVLVRLLENSFYFAPERGEVSLTVSKTGEKAGNKDIYEFVIRNLGTEIPPEIIGRIFERDSWQREGEFEDLPGVGFGMTVAKSYIERMGGTAAAKSLENGETEFIVSLPFAPAPEEIEKSGAQPEGTAELPEKSEKPLRVLLVDDNAINREIGEQILLASGYEVSKAESGEQAVDMVAASAGEPYDAVLMDIQMPGIDGYEATERIRALPDKELSGVVIIALTANTFREDVSRALEAGMDGHAAKPIDPVTLCRTIEKAVRGKR